MRIGIISGVKAEADAFMRDEKGKAMQLGPLDVRVLSLSGHHIRVICCGIGKVNAAIATALLAETRVDIMLIIGTAGKLSALPGNCFTISDAFQCDYGAWRDTGFAHYTAGSWPIGPAKLRPFTAAQTPDIGLPSARIVSGDSFIESAARGAAMQKFFGADLIDMETAAMAQVAARFRLPWAAIKAVTDHADGKSEGDFQRNLAQAAEMAAEAMQRLIVKL